MHGLTHDFKKNIQLLKDIGPGDNLFDIIYDDRESAGCEDPMKATDEVIEQLVRNVTSKTHDHIH